MTAPQALFALLAYYGVVLLFLHWMTTRHVDERPVLYARPQPDLDIAKLRQDIQKRYAKTLAYLARH